MGGVGLPIQVGAWGMSVGVYGDVSYTKILFSGNINDAVTYLINEIHGSSGDNVSKAQITNSINYINSNN